MQDIVIIPTYDRPELLWLCLEHIAASPDHQSVELRVYVDAHVGHPAPPREDIEAVLEKFSQLNIQTVYRAPHHFHGNSFNVLMAYKEAFESSAQYVFMVEDDIVVQPEFFAWHRQQHSVIPIDCSIGVGKRPEHAHYASLGVCFRREVIEKVIPHCRVAYFNNMNGYCRSQFPASKWHCEQDGLWCRVLGTKLVVWPVIPVAQHIGWYGYHRKKSVRPLGALIERYHQVKIVLGSSSVLGRWSKDFSDITTVNNFCN